MTKRWKPVVGDFHCPGRIVLSVDELGITIGTTRRALAASEWPGENVRLCELVEEPETPQQIPEDVQDEIKKVLYVYFMRHGPNKTYKQVNKWLKSLKKESADENTGTT